MTTPTLEDIDTLARTIYGEARGEGRQGMEAVAAVILNRQKDQRWPNTIAAVCRQPSQFSCWLPDDPNLPKLVTVDLDDPAFRRSYAVATTAVLCPEWLPDRTDGANHYLATWLFESDRRPKWADPRNVTCTIGGHVFLRL